MRKCEEDKWWGKCSCALHPAAFPGLAGRCRRAQRWDFTTGLVQDPAASAQPLLSCLRALSPPQEPQELSELCPPALGSGKWSHCKWGWICKWVTWEGEPWGRVSGRAQGDAGIQKLQVLMEWSQVSVSRGANLLPDLPVLTHRQKKGLRGSGWSQHVAELFIGITTVLLLTWEKRFWVSTSLKQPKHEDCGAGNPPVGF